MGEKILVLDSDRGSKEGISALLLRAGYKAVAVEDGLLGLQALKKERDFAAVVIDDEVGGSISGLEVLQRIKDIYPYMPVVMRSDSWTPESILDCTEVGAFFCVEKGASSDLFLRVLTQAVEGHKAIP